MKSFKINNLKTLFLIILLATFSCQDDFLDRLPLGEVANTEELGVGGFETEVFGVYSLLRTTTVGSWNRYWFGSIRSDDASKGSTAGDSAANGTAFNDFQYIATNGLSTAWWNDHYRVIFACNEIINKVQETEGDIDEGTLINESEVRAIRALMYFELRRDFGEVPIITITIDNPEDAFAPKSTVAEVDTFIMDDLAYASQYLPLSWPNYPGRATLGFANSLWAKLYLYQEDWSNAYDKCQEVISSGMYSLDTDLVRLFDVEGDNGPESIFEIQQLRTEENVDYNNNYYVSQGVRGSGDWNLGWGFNVPTMDLINAFEAGDLRYGTTILESGQSDGAEFGNNVLPGSPPLSQPYWNKKAYTKSSTRADYGVNGNRWENIKIIRYADIILMAAEAANEQGNTSSAIPLINQIRSRAGLADITASDQSGVRNAIKQERRVEFALEEYRFYDLVRWGDATSVLGSLGYVPRNALYPIPQEAIDQSGGLLVQNPDY